MKRIETINVIPFIDIMLVLLTIVLMSATFILHGRLELTLPEADPPATALPSEAQEIAIDREGTLYLNAEAISLQALDSRLATLAKETPLTLRVDASATFAHFVSVAERLKRYQLHRLTVLTQRH